MKTKGLTQEELEKFLKENKEFDFVSEPDDGNDWSQHIFKIEDRYFSLEFLNGRPCRRMPYKKTEEPVYDLMEVEPEEVTITQWNIKENV
jgi:hypothetical protein